MGQAGCSAAGGSTTSDGVAHDGRPLGRGQMHADVQGFAPKRSQLNRTMGKGYNEMTEGVMCEM